MSKETVGKISRDLQLKTPDTDDPIELQREMHKDYVNNIIQCVNTHKPLFDGDFYIVVLTKKEKLMPNVLRNYFTARQSCPTPNYDQAVYKYHAKNEDLEFIWTIPSKDTCIYLKEHAMEVAPEERALRDFVLAFADGTLFRMAKKLNNEKTDSPLLQN